MKEWKWYWRQNDDGNADCGVYYEERPGQVYSVCRCPRYLTEQQWTEYARLIAAAPALPHTRFSRSAAGAWDLPSASMPSPT